MNTVLLFIRLVAVIAFYLGPVGALQATLDLDGDNLSDVWQSLYPQIAGQLDKDYDGDGETNYEEGITRTNPLSASSHLKLSIDESDTATHANVSWFAEAGVEYLVQEGNLMDEWNGAVEAPDEIVGAGAITQLDVSYPDTPASSSFWRIAVAGPVADADGDLLDGWEENRLGSDVDIADSDNDGIPDGKDFAYAAGPTVYSPAGLGVLTAGELAGKLVRYGNDGTPFAVRAFGVNYYDGFQRYIRDVEDRSFVEGFEYLEDENIPVARVLLGGFWPADWNLYFSDKAEYYRRLDDFIDQAERKSVGLIFTLFWHISTVGDVVQDAVDAGYLIPGIDFVPSDPLNVDSNGDDTYDEYRTALARANSGSTALVTYVTEEVVNRYKGSPAIWGWEFSNELNLSLDLPNPIPNRPTVLVNQQMNLSRDDSSVAAYESKDDLTRAHIQIAKEHFASVVRVLDPWRFISSGDSRPRASAYNNWQTQTFGKSSRAELAQVLPIDHPTGYDSLSIHLYANNESYFSDSPAVDLTFETGDYAEFLEYFMGQSATLGKPLFVGEWGAIGDGTTDAEKTTFHRMMQALIDEGVQLSLLWTFDNLNTQQISNWWVNPGTDKEYQLTNDDPDLWDLEQVNTTYGAW